MRGPSRDHCTISRVAFLGVWLHGFQKAFWGHLRYHTAYLNDGIKRILFASQSGTIAASDVVCAEHMLECMAGLARLAYAGGGE